MPDRARALSWGILVGLIGLIAGVIIYDARKSIEAPIEPRPFNASELAQLGDVSKLRPPMRRLVESIKAGKVLGAPVDSLMGDLEKADEISRGKTSTTYRFLLHPEAGRQEFNVELTISSQNKFGQIYCVSVVDPCY